MSFRTRRAVLLSAVLLLAGCATTPPSSFYVLSPAVPAGAAVGGDGPAIGLGPFDLPEYLDRPQLVARAGPTELSLDELHRWGGSLQEDFLRVLGENLAYELDTSRVLLAPGEVRFPLDYRVVGDVIAFEGRHPSEAVLKVRWVILDPHRDQPLATGERVYREPVAGEGVPALVDAMSGALAAFSRDLAGEIRGLPRPRPPEVEPPPI